jgi:hypothetical protein
MADKQPNDTYTDEEAARRRDAVVRRMIATPPQPRKPAAKGKMRQASKGRPHKGGRDHDR